MSASNPPTPMTGVSASPAQPKSAALCKPGSSSEAQAPPVMMNGEPLPYIISRLRSLAPYFWTRPETVDLVVVIPLAGPRVAATPSALSPAGPRSSNVGKVAVSSPLRTTSPPAPIGVPSDSAGLYARRKQKKAGQSDGGEALPHVEEEQAAPASQPPPSSTFQRTSSSSSIVSAAQSSDSNLPSSASTAPSTASFNADEASTTTWQHAQLSVPVAEARRSSAPGLSAPDTAKAPMERSLSGNASTPLAAAPTAGSKRVTGEPATPSSPSLMKLTFRLHADYLTTQSSLFRKLLIESKGPSSPMSAKPDGALAKPRRLASDGKGGAMLPVVLLPLPDPYAFSAILHYLYFGDFNVLAAAMDSGKVRWEGVVANAEAIGCDMELKRHLGRYWRSRIANHQPPPSAVPTATVERSTRDSMGAYSMASWIADKAASQSAAKQQAKRALPADEDVEMSERPRSFATPPHPSKLRRISRDEAASPYSVDSSVVGAMERVRIAPDTPSAGPSAGLGASFVSGLMRRREKNNAATAAAAASPAAAGRKRSKTWTSNGALPA